MFSYHVLIDERSSLSGAPTEFRFVGFQPEVLEAMAGDIAGLELLDEAAPMTTVSGALLTPLMPTSPCFGGNVFDADGRPVPEARVRRRDEGVVFGDPDDSAPPAPAARRLPEAFYGGVLFGGYGHIVLESLARLTPRAAASTLPILFHVTPALRDSLPLFRAMFEALGVDSARFAAVEGPIRVDRLYAPRPGVTIGERLHLPHVRFLLDRLGARDGGPGDRPILLSRSALKGRNRQAFGERELEAWLAPGAEVVHPERLGFTEQVRLANASNRYLGFIGSQMHNLLFNKAERPLEVLYFCSRRVNRAYFQIDLLTGGRKTYVNAAGYDELFEFGNGAPFIVDLERARRGVQASGLLPATGGPMAGEDPAALRKEFRRAWMERFLYLKLIRRLPQLEPPQRLARAAEVGRFWRSRTRSLDDPGQVGLLREAAERAFHRHRALVDDGVAEAFMRMAFGGEERARR